MSDDRANFDEIYAACLDAIHGGQETLDAALERYAGDDPELRDRLKAALILSDSQELFAPRPGFVSASRSRLVSRIREEQAATASRRSSLWARMAAVIQSLWRQPRMATALVVMLVLIFSGALAGQSTLTATASAIPGDQIYPLKLLVEDARLVLALDDAIDARIHMQSADQRVSELDALVTRGRLDYIPATVHNYELQLNEAVRLLNVVTARNTESGRALAGEFSTKLASQKDKLTSLASTAPETALPDFLLALTLTENGIASVETVLMLAEANPLQTHTPTITAALTLTSIPSATAQASATTTSASLSPTPTGAGLQSPAISPTVSLEPVVDPIPPTITPELKPTKKPTKTPKPLPEPTRRPPKKTP